MAEFSSHAQGSFCWPELSTTDQKSGTAFYRDLLGWHVNDMPMGPGEVYSMFELRTLPVAAAYTMRPDERQHGVPPHWSSYIAVANADEATTRAQELGAKVLAPPFDVMDVGRMAVLQDPQGAVFSLWQAKRHIGARIKQEPGALGWTELVTRDTKGAEQFYTKFLGWSAKTSTAGNHPYTEFALSGAPEAGMMPMDPAWGDMPSYWMPYFLVTDCDATAEKAKQLKGNVMVPPTSIENNLRFAVLQDPQGAVFGVVKISR